MDLLLAFFFFKGKALLCTLADLELIQRYLSASAFQVLGINGVPHTQWCVQHWTHFVPMAPPFSLFLE